MIIYYHLPNSFKADLYVKNVDLWSCFPYPCQYYLGIK